MDWVTGDSAFTPLVEWATQVHEIFAALQNAGFTEAQALALIAGMLGSTMHGFDVTD